MKRRILWVDDDPNILSGARRSLRRHVEFQGAADADEGLGCLRRDGPFAVIVSDFVMPGLNGIEFLARARELAPDSVRIMVTGFADQQVAIHAVNRGQIFRFLTKPASTGEVLEAVEAAVRQHDLIMAERNLLEETFLGSIEMLMDVLALVHPVAFRHVRAVQALAVRIAQAVGHAERWKLEAAAILSQVGYVAVPTEILEKSFRGRALSREEQSMLDSHPRVTNELLARIPRLEEVAAIIAADPRRRPPGETPAAPPIARAAEILRLALDLDRIRSRGENRAEALARLKRESGVFSARLRSVLDSVELEAPGNKRQQVAIEHLQNGMMIDEDIVSKEAMLLVSRGLLVSETIRQRLQNFRLRGEIDDLIWVRQAATGAAT